MTRSPIELSWTAKKKGGAGQVALLLCNVQQRLNRILVEEKKWWWTCKREGTANSSNEILLEKSVRKRKEDGSDVSLLFGWRELLFWKIAVNRRTWWDTHYTGVNWWQLKIYLFWNLLQISGICCRHRSLGCQKTESQNLSFYSTIRFTFCSQGKF